LKGRPVSIQKKKYDSKEKRSVKKGKTYTSNGQRERKIGSPRPMGKERSIEKRKG